MSEMDSVVRNGPETVRESGSPHICHISMYCWHIPQSSVLGPLLFTAYVAPFGRVIESFGIGYHQFPDDTQLFVAWRTQPI